MLHTGGFPNATFFKDKKSVAGFSQQRKHSQLCDVDGDDVGDDDGDGGGGGDDGEKLPDADGVCAWQIPM